MKHAVAISPLLKTLRNIALVGIPLAISTLFSSCSETDYAAIQKQNSDLAKKIEVLATENSDLTTQNDSLKIHANHVYGLIQNLSTNTDSLEQTIAATENSIDTLQQQNKLLQENLAETLAAKDSIQGILTSMEKTANETTTLSLSLLLIIALSSSALLGLLLFFPLIKKWFTKTMKDHAEAELVHELLKAGAKEWFAKTWAKAWFWSALRSFVGEINGG